MPPLDCIEDPLYSNLSKLISKKTNIPLMEKVGYTTPGSLGSWAADQKIPIITFELPSKSIAEMRKLVVPTLIELLTNISLN